MKIQFLLFVCPRNTQTQLCASSPPGFFFLHWQNSHASLADYKRFKTATEGVFSWQRKHQWITPERRSRCSTCCNTTKQMTEKKRERETEKRATERREGRLRINPTVRNKDAECCWEIRRRETYVTLLLIFHGWSRESAERGRGGERQIANKDRAQHSFKK